MKQRNTNECATRHTNRSFFLSQKMYFIQTKHSFGQISLHFLLEVFIIYYRHAFLILDLFFFRSCFTICNYHYTIKSPIYLFIFYISNLGQIPSFKDACIFKIFKAQLISTLTKQTSFKCIPVIFQYSSLSSIYYESIETF